MAKIKKFWAKLKNSLLLTKLFIFFFLFFFFSFSSFFLSFFLSFFSNISFQTHRLARIDRICPLIPLVEALVEGGGKNTTSLHTLYRRSFEFAFRGNFHDLFYSLSYNNKEFFNF